jgi:hypothetical protein
MSHKLLHEVASQERCASYARVDLLDSGLVLDDNVAT